MATLEDLAERLGPKMLAIIRAPRGNEVEISDVAVYDPSELGHGPPGALYLGVGLGQGSNLTDAVEALGNVNASALALKPEILAGLDVESLPNPGGVALLSLTEAANWAQMVVLFRSAIGPDQFLGPEELAGIAAGDLFAVANAVAALIDAPVTIEDAEQRVLAYSAGQERADAPRSASILGRRVPDKWIKWNRETGVMQRLSRERGPIFVEGFEDMLPRTVVAVRAGDQVLGSIWAMCAERLSTEKEKAFAEAANFVAIHLLRNRLTSDTERSLAADLLATVLEGGALARDAARRLRLTGDAFRVVALNLIGGDPVDNEIPLLGCWRLLSLHLSPVHRGFAVGLVGGGLYAVIPTPREAEVGLRLTRTACAGFAGRCIPSTAERLVIGIGAHARSLTDIPASPRDADQVVRVLQARKSASIAEIEEVRMQSLVLRLADLAADEPLSVSGPLGRLVEQDRKHGTDYVTTLRAYLDCFGDIKKASKQLGVHRNTLRYRVGKLAEYSQADLDDADQRLAIMLQLRLLDARGGW